MAEEAGKGPTSLIVVSADPARLDEAVERAADELGVEPDVARQILQGAPLVFITGLTKAEVRTLTPRLLKVSEAGVEFRLTQQQTGTLPRVNWPMRPSFAPGQTVAAAVEWGNNAFVCPGCGEAFVFKRMGRPGATEEAAAPAKAPPPPVPPPKAAAPKPPPPPPPAPVSEEFDLTADLMAVDGEAPPPPPPAPVEEAPAEAEPVAAAVEAPAPDPGNLDDLLSSDQGDPLDLDAAFGTEGAAEAEAPAPPEEAPAPEAAAEPALDAIGGELLSAVEGTAEAPAAEAAPAAAPEDEGGERFNVFVSALRTDEARQAAAKLIADFRKIPMAEALKLVKRPMIKAADKVGKEAAEKLIAEFKKAKIAARMTKAAGG